MPKPLDIPTLKRALAVAAKRIPLASRKQRNEALSYAADDFAEAYEIGVEEAQSEIIARLRELHVEAALPHRAPGGGTDESNG